MGKSIVCPICGQSFIGLKKHYEIHRGEMSFNEFFAKVYGYPEITKCPHCGNECSINWGTKKFNKTCGSKECIDKQFSESRSALWQDPEFKLKQHNSRVEAWKNPQKRENRMNALLPVFQSQEFKKKMSDVVIGRSSDSEYKRKLSESSRRHWESSEYREKFTNSIKRTLSTPESKVRMSERSKNSWKDPGYRRKIHDARIKQWENPEFRKMMSENSSKRMTETLRKLQVESDRSAILYLIGFKDTITDKYCVKVGITVDFQTRFFSYIDMGYTFVKGYKVDSVLGKVTELENLIHNHRFVKLEMDNRKSRFLRNGYTEWYQSTELYKIRSFIESQGYTLTEIKL